MKRIFISFAIEDKNLRDLLKGQAKNENSPFEFVDMSVKVPWDSNWKTNCRSRIKRCDGVISIITKNTKKADGQIWEMKCAKEERIPIIGILGNSGYIGTDMPPECGQIKLMSWAWDSISKWLDKL